MASAAPPADPPAARARGRTRALGVVALLAGTSALSAALLFLVQPMFARLVLPLLGGVPAVWTTSVLLFQAALLAGYLYVHLLTRRLPVRRQLAVHGALLLLPLPLLPFGLLEGWEAPAGGAGAVVPWLLGVFAATVGLPYLVVATTAPLLGRWAAGGARPLVRDPYALYAASNAGSLLGLLAYPLALEPALPLGDHGAVWAVGYVAFVLLAFGCLAWRWRAGREGEAPGAPAAGDGGPAPSWGRRAAWVGLAAVPVSLMLAVTQHLTTDVAPVPLLWVLPLALYLLTFVAAFGLRSGAVLARWVGYAFGPAVVGLAVVVGLDTSTPLVGIGLAHLLVFALAALGLHLRLAGTRPAPAHLPEFYVWIAVGGALGGAWNSLVAPLVFSGLTEYPLALVLACLGVALPALLPARRGPADLVVPAALGAAVAVLVVAAPEPPLGGDPVAGWIAPLAAAALLAVAATGRGARLALGLGAVLLALQAAAPGTADVLERDRSWFGTHQVVRDPDGRFHRLQHGTTLHGAQAREPGRRREPQTYYHRTGPVGQLIAGLPDRRRLARTAVVGLGVGTMACHARAGETWTFYEIDPSVERVARDPRLFTYLRDCPGRHRVVVGDGRARLREAPDGAYGLVVLDAFNSDAIPVHLLTREAIALDVRKLAPGGVLAVHLSNRWADLEPVVGAVARSEGLVCREQTDLLVEGDMVGKSPSHWAVLARKGADLGRAGTSARWGPCEAARSPWTDGRSDVLGVLDL